VAVRQNIVAIAGLPLGNFLFEYLEGG